MPFRCGVGPPCSLWCWRARGAPMQRAPACLPTAPASHSHQVALPVKDGKTGIGFQAKPSSTYMTPTYTQGNGYRAMGVWPHSCQCQHHTLRPAVRPACCLRALLVHTLHCTALRAPAVLPAGGAGFIYPETRASGSSYKQGSVVRVELELEGEVGTGEQATAPQWHAPRCAGPLRARPRPCFALHWPAANTIACAAALTRCQAWCTGLSTGRKRARRTGTLVTKRTQPFRVRRGWCSATWSLCASRFGSACPGFIE